MISKNELFLLNIKSFSNFKEYKGAITWDGWTIGGQTSNDEQKIIISFKTFSNFPINKEYIGAISVDMWTIGGQTSNDEQKLFICTKTFSNSLIN